MKPGQGDVGDALWTLLLGPIVGVVITLLFAVVMRIYVVLRPVGTDGPFTGAYETIGTSLSISYSLFQLASSIETWVAIAILGITAYGFVAGLGGGRGRGGLGRR